MNISRLALRFSMDEVDADVVLCGTARMKELEENIAVALSPLSESELALQKQILAELEPIKGDWEGNELTAYWNRINGVEDDLPYFRDWTPAPLYPV